MTATLEGVEERDINGIHVLRLHYTADPRKRTPEWREQAQRGLKGRDWRREYEIDWTVASGLPVYAEEFVREWHVAKQPLLADPKRTVYVGWDYGLTPAAVWLQMDAAGRINVLGEHVTWTGRGEMRQMGIERFTPEVVRLTNEWFPGAEVSHWADPAGWAKAQTDEKTCVQIQRQHGVDPRQGPVTFTARHRAMVEVLTRTSGGRACLQVSPDCTMVIEGLAGAYRYEQIGETGRYKESVEKNAWSHVIDALSYAVGGLYVPTKRDVEDDRPRHRAKGRCRVTGY